MQVSGASFLSFMALVSASLMVMPGLVGTKVWPWVPRWARTMVRTGDLGGRWLTTPPLALVEDVDAEAAAAEEEEEDRGVADWSWPPSSRKMPGLSGGWRDDTTGVGLEGAAAEAVAGVGATGAAAATAG